MTREVIDFTTYLLPEKSEMQYFLIQFFINQNKELFSIVFRD